MFGPRNGEWQPGSLCTMFAPMDLIGFGAAISGVPIYTVTFAASENNPNMAAKFTAAGWDGVSPFIGDVVVNAGVIVGATSAATPAMDLTSGSFPAGTLWQLTNNGRIAGKGGTGGGGGNPGAPNGSGFWGGDGGTALKINKPITITNGAGEIWGGGGGGAGGGVTLAGTSNGGGGGAGTQAGAGGAGEGGGSNGSAGTATAGGAAGGAHAGAGGANGAAGSAGSTSDAGWGPGGAGAAGKYIDGIAHVAWISGSGSPNVKGGTV